MKFSTSRYILLSVACLFLVSCGGGGGNANNNLTPNNSTPYEGRWFVPVGCSSVNSSESFVQALDITSSTFDLSWLFYATADCSGNQLGVVKANYDLTFRADVESSTSVCNNIKEFDLTLTGGVVDNRTLSAQETQTELGVPPNIYSVMCASSDKLFLGVLAPTEETRSSQIDRQIYYVKKLSSLWIKNSFNNAAVYKNRCENPRVNVTNPKIGGLYTDVSGSQLDEKNWLRSWTNEEYLWYDEVDDQDPALFNGTAAYFDVLKTFATTSSGKDKDEFHFTVPTAEYLSQSQSGITYGYGMELIALSNSVPRDLRVIYTQPNSPATTANVIRGAKILKVDGVDFVNATGQQNGNIIYAGLSPKTIGESHTFEIQDPVTNLIRSITMVSSEVVIQPVQNVKVINTGTGQKVGYMQFNEHIATAEQQLIDAVTQFKTANIDDLVVDFRYNGGGSLYIAAELSSMIAGPTATNNNIMGKLQFNDKQGEVSFPFYTKTPSFSAIPDITLPNLDLSRVFVITGANTCSASEAFINSLRGVDIEVIQIGETTCGKPYGFQGVDNCSSTYFSINFKTENAKGFSDYADGFSPQDTTQNVGVRLSGCSVTDDYTHQLGDTSEKRLAMALYYQANGACATSAKSRDARSLDKLKSRSSEGQMIKPAWLQNMTIN